MDNLAAEIWVFSDDADRDAIGSNDGLQLENRHSGRSAFKSSLQAPYGLPLLDGNGSNVEQPGAGFVVSSTVNVTTAGFAGNYHFDGATWLLMSAK